MRLDKKKLGSLFTIASKIDLALKKEAMVKLITTTMKQKLRKQSIRMIGNSCEKISRRLTVHFFRGVEAERRQFAVSNMSELKKKEILYDENYVPS